MGATKQNKWFSSVGETATTISKIAAGAISAWGLLKALMFLFTFSNNVSNSLVVIQGQNVSIIKEQAIIKKTLEVVISQSGGLYWEAGPDGGTIKVGDELTVMTGHLPKDVMGRGWMDFVHPDDYDMVLNNMDRTILFKTDWSCVFRFKFATDGKYHTVKSDARRVLVDGDIIHYVGTIVPVIPDPQDVVLPK